MGTNFFMRLYTKEYLSDSKVRALPREQRSDLIDLWCHCDQDGTIPADPVAVGRLLGITTAQARKTLTILGSLFQPEGDRLFSPRLRKEHLDRAKESDAHRKGSTLTNAKRWGNRSLSESLSDPPTLDENGHSAIAERVAERSPISIQQSVQTTPPTPRKRGNVGVVLGDYSPEFEEACTTWGKLFTETRRLKDSIPPDKIHVAGRPGSKAASWEVWKRLLTCKVNGSGLVQGPDLLEVVRGFAAAKLQRARDGIELNLPMLPTLLNKPELLDAVVHVVKTRSASPAGAA